MLAKVEGRNVCLDRLCLQMLALSLSCCVDPTEHFCEDERTKPALQFGPRSGDSAKLGVITRLEYLLITYLPAFL